jgi:predicted nucleic acid-binding protein
VTILVDSDVLIEISRDRDKSVVARWRTLAESDSAILCSPVSAAELWTGARADEHDALTNLFRALQCVPIDYETGRQAGEYMSRYRKSHGVQIGDALIAAAAVLNHAAVWTRNRRHYPMRELTFY